MKMQYFPASDRGIKDIGWLKSNFFFSFSDYYHPMRSAFGSLIAFNDDFVQAGKGFGIHPHVNMEIISVLLKGKMNHKYTMGYSTEIEGPAVQIMSAGSGLSVQDQVLQERDSIGLWEKGEVTLQCAEKTEFLIIETPINQK
jgi:redox-sensitive bicupin YhaK (pirin superfamily)